MFAWIENSSRTPSSLQFWTQSTIQIKNSSLEESGGTVLLIIQIMKRNNKICCLRTTNKILKINRQAKTSNPFGLTEDSLLDQLLLICEQIKSIYWFFSKMLRCKPLLWPTEIYMLRTAQKLLCFVWFFLSDSWGFFSKNTTNLNRIDRINDVTQDSM